jgi:hypothetical protein
MKKPRLPWTLRGSDFSKEGWHTDPTAAYQLMFEFLRLSPTYELARRVRNGTLTRSEEHLLPSDFDSVLKTYDLIGDVNCVLFRQWWLKRGLQVFGNPYTKPKIHEVAFLANGQETDVDLIASKIKNRFAELRQAEGLSASLILSLPLGLKRSEIMRRVRLLLDEYKVKEIGESAQPQIKLMGRRFHGNAMFKGLRLLWFKSAKPKWELWRLGAKSELSDSYSKVLDPRAPRRTQNPREIDDRLVMGKITHRAIERFEKIVENAARGKFPSDQPVETGAFDYSAIAKRLLVHAKWVKATKSEWLLKNT